MRLDVISLPALHDEVEKVLRFEYLADPWTLALDDVDKLLPADLISTTEWATRYRKFLGKGGAVVDWRPETTPYTPAIQDACDDPKKRVVAVRGPGRAGKTSAFENHMGKVGHYGPPQGMFLFMQSDDDVDTYAEERWEPFFNLHPEIARKIGHRPKDNTMTRKRVDGQLWQLLAASLRTLRGKAAPLIGADEIDGWNKRVRSAALALVLARQGEYGGNAFAYFASHPDAGPKDGISAIIADSDDRYWYWLCGHCGKASSPYPGTTWQSKLYLPELDDVARDEIPELVAQEARIKCPHCRGLIDDTHRLEINAKGLWVAKGQTIDEDGTIRGEVSDRETAGFSIHGLMSPWVTIGGLARMFINAKLQYDETGRDVQLREVTVKHFGECFTGPDKKHEIGDWKKVRARLSDKDLRLGRVPQGARFLTAFVDVQGNRFEVGVIAWDEYGESWLVDRYAILQWPEDAKGRRFSDVAPAERLGDWDLVFESVVKATYPLDADPSLHLGMAKICVDSGGEPGVTHNARLWLASLLARNLVQPWQVLLTKGASSNKGELYGTHRPMLKDELGRAFAAPVPERTVNVFEIKKIIASRIQHDPPGPFSMHLPAGLPAKYWRELCSETLIGDDWIKSGRNETWDIWIGCEVARAITMILPDKANLDWDKKLPPYAKPFPDPALGDKRDGGRTRLSRYERYARLNA